MTTDESELRAELDRDEAREFFALANKSIRDGSKEDPLRYLLCTKLPDMFPSKPWWITEHASQAEANETYNVEGSSRSGFADVLIGRTAVEYEKNLAQPAIFTEGYTQVEDYCAGLLNKGVSAQDIIGVLSDTVRWHAYSVAIEFDSSVSHEGLWGRDDLELEEIDSVDMSDVSDENLDHFEDFINRFYGRYGSRELTPESLVSDFGLENSSTKNYQNAIRAIVDKAMSDNPSYASLIKRLWTGFVGSVGVGSNSFVDDYSHELYITTLAKLIVANALKGGSGYQGEAELREILNGDFFKAHGIDNLVEYDYFGWINEGENLNDLAKCAAGIQRDLSVYDFSNLKPSDLFGPLISQLATHDRRILLGQAPTPQWLARRMVDSVIKRIGGEQPHLVDMCCGSGIFIVEVLRHLLADMGDPETIDDSQRLALSEAVYGFDVDPLTVLLAKANWILVMRKYIDSFPEAIHIPVYHADSLFTRTPVSRHDSAGAEECEVTLYDRRAQIPSILLDPVYRGLFDEFVEKAEAFASSGGDVSQEAATAVIARSARSLGCPLDEQQLSDVSAAFLDFVGILSDLRARGRNGVWPFVLGNAFRPALTSGRFNGIVSNPPWLALSRITSNPYKQSTVLLAQRYGIMPTGSSFLHVELATVFLLASVDRYLADGGIAACVMPHSILNGRHEEQFRSKGYLSSEKRVDLSLFEIWELPRDTFKNRAAVIFVSKAAPKKAVTGEVPGLVFSNRDSYSNKNFRLLTNGKATAYSTNGQKVEDALDLISFEQGFDGMPRTAVFFKAEKQQNGKWKVSSIPATGDKLSFAVKDGKKCKHFSIGAPISNIDDSLLFSAITSSIVQPFAAVNPLTAVLPIKVAPNNGIELLSERELSLLGQSNLLLTRKILSCSDDGEEFYPMHKGYLPYVDNRNKLTKSLSDSSEYLVLYGAGGKNVASTFVKRGDAQNIHRLVVDQTLYWKGVDSEAEALYYVALLNSTTLNEAIKDFQPEGNFGERHIHTLPLGFIEEYDPEDARHQEIAEKSKVVTAQIREACRTDSRYIVLVDPSTGSLSSRRRRFQELLHQLPEFKELDEACRAVL